MAKNITLLGASFPDVPSVVLPTAEGSTAEFFDTTDATLDNNAKMLSGYTAYANGVKYSGTIPVNNHTNVTVSGATVTTASGYYSSAVTKSVISGELQDITFPAAPSVSVNTLTGMVTVSYSKTFSGIKPVTKTGYIPSTASISALIYGTSSYSLPTISGTTITPTDAFQTAIPAGTFATGDINVAAIPSDYLGPGVVPVSSTDITFSGSEVTIPSGYYSEAITSTVASGALADVALGGALAGQATANYSQISTIPTAVSIDPTTGEVTATFSKSFSGITPVGSAGFLSTGASHNVNVYGTGTYSLSTVGARTITPTGVKRLVVSSGYYTTGDVYVKAIPSTYVGSGISRASGQTITPSSGSVLAVSAGTFITGNINVGAIPSAYIIPSGTVTIIKNGIYDVASWNSVNATIMPNLQSISITPSVDEQIVTPLEEEVGKNQIVCNDVTFARRINIDFSTFAVGDTCHLYGRMYLSNGNHDYFPITIDENFSWEETNIRTYQVGNTDCYKITLTNSYISFEALKTNYGSLYVKGVDYDPYFHVYKKSYDGFSQVTVGAVPSGVDDTVLNSILDRTITGTYTNSTLTRVGVNAFASCNLTEVVLPNVSMVRPFAFASCSLLQSVFLETATHLGNNAFDGCSSLTTISAPSVTTINGSAFISCRSLESIDFPLITGIDNLAFAYCTALHSVSLPTVKNVYTNAFSGCSALVSVNLPKCGLLSSQAFRDCTSLTTVIAPNCSTVSTGCFSNCTALASLSMPNVKVLSPHAFRDCTSLISVSFPLVQSSIAEAAFSGCTNLETALCPSATAVFAYAFANCHSLLSASFPLVSGTIGISAFSACTLLSSVYFPLAKGIQSSTFYYCTKLTVADFPSVTSLYTCAFTRCYELSSISFPALQTIGSYAFGSCSALSQAYFPNVTSIYSNAFNNCVSLEMISLPNLSSIYLSSTFANCSNLRSVYLLGSSVAGIGNSNAFSMTPIMFSTYLGYYGSIFVRASMLDSWKSATIWKYFSNRFVGLTDEQIAELDASNGTNP